MAWEGRQGVRGGRLAGENLSSGGLDHGHVPAKGLHRVGANGRVADATRIIIVVVISSDRKLARLRWLTYRSCA